MEIKVLLKIAALGGILYVVLQMTGQMFIQVGGQEPAFNAGQEEIISFFMARNPGLARAGAFLSMLAFIPFIFFVGALWQRLKSGEGKSGWLSNITLGAGLLIVAVQLVSGAGWTIEFNRLNSPRIPELTRFQFDFGNYLFAASWIMMACMLLSTGILSIVTKALPTWTGWFGIVTSLGLIIATGCWYSASGIVFAPVTLFWLWLIVVSVILFRRVTTQGDHVQRF
jgi:hypothetical protein